MTKLETINAEDLQNRTYEPTHFLVDELIPEGLHILAGAPKIGKSWLALWLCLCVAQGQPLWNFATTQGDVLYLSLEDSFQRIQTRLFDLTEDAPPTLHFAIMADTLKHGLEQQIEQFLTEHLTTKLVVIDTLQRVRSAGSDSNLYANDYQDIGLLKKLADKRHIAILLIHHLRKLHDDDPMNMISGSTGLSGAADSAFVLQKHSRLANVAALHSTGRNILDRTLKLEFAEEDHIWKLLEDSKTCSGAYKISTLQLVHLFSELLRADPEYLGSPSALSAKIDPDGALGITPKKVTRLVRESVATLRENGILADTYRSNGKRWISLKRADFLPAKKIGTIDPAGVAGGRCRQIAIVHFVNYKKGTQTRGCMKSVMRYVSKLSKTLWDGQQLVSGIGCQPETAFDEFLSTKLLHHKNGDVMFYHMVQSFPKGANIDPRTAHEAARKLAGYFEGCEVLVCTHVDREHIHSHCIINSVNFETGRKVHMADDQIQELRIRNDQICEELGLPKFQRDEHRQSRGMSNAEYYTASKGESWKFELLRVIDECMRCAGNREEFLVLLRSEGYDATWTDNRKNITYVTPDGRKCRDSKLHIEKYLKENMEAEFGYRTENDNTGNVGAAQKADGRGTTTGTQRDGHGAELEGAARNAEPAVPAADAAGCRPENAPDETERAGIPDRDADERRGIFETGWEPEREVFFRLQRVDRQYAESCDYDFREQQTRVFSSGTGSEEENSSVRMDLDYGGDLVRDAVRLGRAVEQMTDDAPTRDGTTTPPHIDSKRRKKLRQKKTALGHAEDDHEDCRMEQQL